MKKQVLKRAATVAAAMLLTAALTVGGVCAMTHMTHTETEANKSKISSEGSAVSVTHTPSLPDITEESVTPPDDGILIRALDLSNSDTLISDFSGLSPDIDAINRLVVPVLKCDGSPEVLIYHTHATESYADGDTYDDGHVFLSDDDASNMIAVGNIIAETLEANGIGVIHDTFHHNAESYNKAYSSSRRSTIKTLSQYSGIKLVIDIHRDAVSIDGSQRKPLTYINEKPTAQLMLVAGSNHNGWQNNLACSLALQRAMNEMYPTLARPIYFSKGEYNQSLSGGSILIEVGAAGNTLAEAKRAAVCAANAICRAFTHRETQKFPDRSAVVLAP